MQGLNPVWDASYKENQNFLFYPSEEIIRFVSKYIVKRKSLNSYEGINPNWMQTRSLDIGCGIGRHLVYLKEIGLDAWGIDISGVAIEHARNWWREKGFSNPDKHIIKSSASNMIFEKNTFDYAFSHGTLDSMPFDDAKMAMREIHRVMKKEGLFYLDLISNDDSSVPNGFEGEIIVKDDHEKGTVQSYFTISKVEILLSGYFTIIECKLIKHLNSINGHHHSRFHLVLRSI